MADYAPDYGGLDPSILAYLQGQSYQPPQDQVASFEYPIVTGHSLDNVPSNPVVVPPPAPPPTDTSHQPYPFPAPPPPVVGSGQIPPQMPNGQRVGESGAGGDEVAGPTLHPNILQAIHDRFLPNGQPVPLPSMADTGSVEPGSVEPTREAPPEAVAGTVATPTDKQLKTENAAYDKRQAQAAAFAASPEGQYQQAYQQSLEANAQKQRALDAQTKAEAEANDEMAKATKESGDRARAQQAVDQTRLEQDRAQQDKYTNLWMQQLQNAATYQVDTRRDVGLRGMLAIALSGIGDALDHVHGPNKAAQMIDAQIDKRIADQWRQKDELGKQAGQTKSIIDHFRGMADDDRQALQFNRAAARLDAADQLQEIAAAHTNPIAAAKAQAMSAGLKAEAAQITAGEAQRKVAAQNTAAARALEQQKIGIEQTRAGEEVRHNKAVEKETARENDLKLEENKANNLARVAAKDAAAAAKIKEQGVFDPGTGEVLLDKTALPIITKAKQLEAQAAHSQDPVEQARLQKQADDLRTTAATEHAITIEDKEGKIKDKLAGAQTLMNTTQRIRDALDDGSILDRDTRAKLKTEADNAFTSWAELNGVNPSSREYEVYKDAIGALDGISATNYNKAPLKSSLDALDTGTKNKTGNLIRGRGGRPIDKDGNAWSISAERGTGTPNLSGETSVEANSNAALGPVSSRLSFSTNDQRGLEAENNSELTPTGLTKADDDKLVNLIGQFGKKSVDDNARVVQAISDYVSSPGDDERKQAISNAVLGRVKAENPQLYAQVLATLPDEQRAERMRLDATYTLDPGIVKRISGGK